MRSRAGSWWPLVISTPRSGLSDSLASTQQWLAPVGSVGAREADRCRSASVDDDAGSRAWDRGESYSGMPMPAPDYELGQFFDLSPDLLCIAGFDGYFKRLNPSFERVLGYSGGELMSRPFLEFVHPDDVERARDAFIHRATGEDVIGFECRLVCVDGSVRRFEWNTRTLPHLGVQYGVARDVTVRSALAEEQAALRRVATLVARGVPRPTCSRRSRARRVVCSASTPCTWAATTPRGRSAWPPAGAARVTTCRAARASSSTGPASRRSCSGVADRSGSTATARRAAPPPSGCATGCTSPPRSLCRSSSTVGCGA